MWRWCKVPHLITHSISTSASWGWFKENLYTLLHLHFNFSVGLHWEWFLCIDFNRSLCHALSNSLCLCIYIYISVICIFYCQVPEHTNESDTCNQAHVSYVKRLKIILSNSPICLYMNAASLEYNALSLEYSVSMFWVPMQDLTKSMYSITVC